jgi:outer membrane receptor protein involved in Fe transport
MFGSRSFKFVLASGTAFAGFTTMPTMAAAQVAPGTAAPTGTATTAQAAQQPPTIPGEIVVTGTRVARDGFDAPTPLTVLTREEIENTSPTNNIADFVNQQPVFAASIRPSNSRLELSNGIAGINALNLRSLGTVRTLVLVDGRRSVGSTANGVVDINTIPQALVERVEVVTGGASAAYGSDAVAGVTNFILNKKFNGIRISADSGITDKGDGFNYSADIAAGFGFAGDRGGRPTATSRAISCAGKWDRRTRLRAASSPSRAAPPPTACAAPISGRTARSTATSMARSPFPRTSARASTRVPRSIRVATGGSTTPAAASASAPKRIAVASSRG